MKHFAEVDCDTLADGLVDRVFNIQLFQGVVAGVEHTENTNDTIVVDLVISEVEGEQLIVSEEQLCNHHGTISLDLIHIQIQILEVTTFFQCLGQELSTLTLDLVSLNVETEKSWTFADEVCQSLRSLIGDVVVTQIYILDVNGKLVERGAESNECLIINPIVEVVLIVSLDDDLQSLVVLHRLFKVLHKAVVGLYLDFFALLFVQESDFLLVKLSVLFSHNFI